MQDARRKMLEIESKMPVKDFFNWVIRALPLWDHRQGYDLYVEVWKEPRNGKKFISLSFEKKNKTKQNKGKYI